MRIAPCHPLLRPHVWPCFWPRPLLARRPLVCEPVVPCERMADLPLRTYDQNLHRQDVQRVGTDEPVASTVIPFDLRLARLNAQLRAAESDARRLSSPALDAAEHPGRTMNLYA